MSDDFRGNAANWAAPRTQDTIETQSTAVKLSGARNHMSASMNVAEKYGTVWVPHLSGERHLWWHVWVVRWKHKQSFEVAALAAAKSVKHAEED
jgi:hypothetical protein